jgi:hypothetical protein
MRAVALLDRPRPIVSFQREAIKKCAKGDSTDHLTFILRGMRALSEASSLILISFCCRRYSFWSKNSRALPNSEQSDK